MSQAGSSSSDQLVGEFCVDQIVYLFAKFGARKVNETSSSSENRSGASGLLKQFIHPAILQEATKKFGPHRKGIHKEYPRGQREK